MQKNIMQKVKEEQKIFHSFKELQEEWQRQGIVKEEEDVIYDDSYSDETEEDNFLIMDWELDCKKSWKTYSARR